MSIQKQDSQELENRMLLELNIDEVLNEYYKEMLDSESYETEALNFPVSAYEIQTSNLSLNNNFSSQK